MQSMMSQPVNFFNLSDMCATAPLLQEFVSDAIIFQNISQCDREKCLYMNFHTAMCSI